jgi:hypothetical protein
MGKQALTAMFSLIYNYAIDCLQSTSDVNAYARELHRLAECLERQRRYKPNLFFWGWK